ncbi:MAG TPA: GTPase [Verrucomicrobiota bacterium]|nr:GTPase [Verrucomicrobiota bacterium]HRZ36227.1 GTPase [Candidatus Paceibacterota bacterium]HRZ56095.1 GTPase [Candidatus Paceibacterota bacterium]
MNDAERKALLGISLIAAFADGEQSDAERQRIQRTGDGLAMGPLDVPELYDHAASGVLSVSALTPSLSRPESRLLAYEMALGICEADDAVNGPERAFLDELQGALGLESASIESARAATRQLQEQVLAPQGAPAASPAIDLPPLAGPRRVILEHAILCGALERMPETLATMAVLPTQMKMIQQIAQIHGIDAGRGRIRDLIASAGVGTTSQVLRGYATRLAQGWLGKCLGGDRLSNRDEAPSARTAFATTHALGQVAAQYYGGGQNLTADQIRAAFEGVMTEALALQAKYTPEIEACSRDLRLQNLLPQQSHT